MNPDPIVELLWVESADSYLVNQAGEYCQLMKFALKVNRPAKDRSLLKVTFEKDHGSDVQQRLAPHHCLKQATQTVSFAWVPIGEDEFNQVVPCKVVVSSPTDRWAFDTWLSFGRRPAYPLRLDGLDAIACEPPPEQVGRTDLFEGCDFETAVPEYLARHRVIYQRPVFDWMDGQVIGNGDLTAIVVNPGSVLTYLTKGDLWAVDSVGRPLGRFPCCSLAVTLPFPDDYDRCTQTMDIASGTVATEGRRPGFRMNTVSWADPEKNVVMCTVEGETDTPIEIEITLARDFLPPVTRLRQDGTRPPNEREYPDFDLPRSLKVMNRRGSIGFLYPLPNMTYAVACKLRGATAKTASRENAAGVAASFTVRVDGPFTFTLATAVATAVGWELSAQESEAVCEAALSLVKPLTRSAVRESEKRRVDHWARFWDRGPFLQLADDPFLENLWYVSLYHVACVSGGGVAPSFLGSWWCEDLPPWRDNYTADSQIEMDFWLAFSSGHSELFHPCLRTFVDLMPYFMANAALGGVDGAVEVPHFFLPEHGTINATRTPGRTFSGSTLWVFQNFIWYYEHTGNERYLRDFLYPTLRALGIWIEKVMLYRDETGRLHTAGMSPEQIGCETDNPFNLSLIQLVCEKLIAYSETLGVAAETSRYRHILDQLPGFLHENGAIVEAREHAHPFRKHPSVFFPVYPGQQIDASHPLAPKFKKTLDKALAFWASRYDSVVNDGQDWNSGGAEPNGHSAAWYSIIAARLGDAKRAWNLLYNPTILLLLKPQGLFAHGGRKTHRWYRSALLDAGNAFGVAINETLVQSYGDHFAVFPAVPKSWTVRFAKLEVPGPFLVSSEIVRGNISYVVVESRKTTVCRLRHPWPRRSVTVEELHGGSVKKLRSKKCLAFPAEAGAVYRISPSNAPVKSRQAHLLPTEPRTEPWVVPLSRVTAGSRQTFFPDILHFQETGQDCVANNAICLGLPEETDLPREGPNIFAPGKAEFDALMKGNAGDRQQALASLTEDACLKRLTVLAAALADRDRLVRWTAAHKLALLVRKTPKVWPLLVDLLASRERQQRWVAGMALREVACTTFGYDAGKAPSTQKGSIERWREWLKERSG